MTVHHSEHLRGVMTTSLPLPLPPHLPLRLPPHPPRLPLRPAVLHQVSVRYHPSPKLNYKHRFIESFKNIIHRSQLSESLQSGYSYCNQDPQRCSLRSKKKRVCAWLYNLSCLQSCLVSTLTQRKIVTSACCLDTTTVTHWPESSCRRKKERNRGTRCSRRMKNLEKWVCCEVISIIEWKQMNYDLFSSPSQTTSQS